MDIGKNIHLNVPPQSSFFVFINVERMHQRVFTPQAGSDSVQKIVCTSAFTVESNRSFQMARLPGPFAHHFKILKLKSD